MHVDVERTTTTRRHRARWALLLLAPAFLLGACKPVQVVTDVTNGVANVFGLGKNEIATPEFEVRNGIKVQVVVKATDDQAGLPVVVHVRCAGGTHASQTVTLQPSGSVSLGQTTFEQGWPAGADCVVSQEIVKGVEVVSSTVSWLSTNVLRADFRNA